MLKRIICCSLVASIMLCIMSCGLKSKDVANEQQEAVELNFVLFGDEPKDMDLILAEFENRTRETLNIKLNIEWVEIDNLKQKQQRILSLGGQIDAIFDAPWVNLNENISLGAYQDIGEYFNSDHYPSLKRLFDDELLEANKVNGKLYTIPLKSTAVDPSPITIRKDLREKYGLPPITTYDEFEVYLQQVQKNNPELIPFSVGGRGFFEMFSNRTEKARKNIMPVSVASASGFDFEVAISEDNKTVLGAVVVAGNIHYGGQYGGDDESCYANFPEGFNGPDMSKMNQHIHFNQYLAEDVSVELNAQQLFENGKSAALEGKLINTDLFRNLNPAAEYELFYYGDYAGEIEDGSIVRDWRANNSLAIPVTSQKTDYTMRFLDWLFSDAENRDLFALGIKGRDWNPIGEYMYEIPKDRIKNEVYKFPIYELCVNPNMPMRIDAALSRQEREKYGQLLDTDVYFPYITSGFVFDTTSVSGEIARVSEIYAELYRPLCLGYYSDAEERVREANRKAKEQGLEAIRAEVIKQVQQFLDEKY